MTLTILLEGGPLHGERHEFVVLRQPEAWPPPDHPQGVYFRTGLYVGGMPVYEWVEA